jgi:YVTN family beta-propeller protein
MRTSPHSPVRRRRGALVLPLAMLSALVAIEVQAPRTLASTAAPPPIAFVANSNSSSVTPIDTATNTAGTPIRVGHDPMGIAITPNGKTAYVVNNGSDTISVIHTATNTAGTPITVGSGPEGIAITPNGKTAYVVNNNDGTVMPIDIATNTAGTAIAVGDNPRGTAIPRV